MPKQFVENNFSIGELSRRTGVNVETIRFYERIALLPRPSRTMGGHRSYGTELCRTLAFIKRCREFEFTLEDIRALLALRGSQGSCTTVKAIAVRRLQDVQKKKQALIRLEAALTQAIARCSEGEMADCAVIEALDADCCQTACSPTEPLQAQP